MVSLFEGSPGDGWQRAGENLALNFARSAPWLSDTPAWGLWMDRVNACIQHPLQKCLQCAGIQIEVKKKCYPQELDTWGRRGATIQATIVHCGGWWDWTLYGPAGPEPRVLRPTIYTDMPSESYTFTDILIKGHIEQGWEITFASFVEENIHWLAYCTEYPTINSPKNLVLGKFLFYWMLCWNFCQTTRLLWPLCLYGLTARKLPLNYM